MNQVGTNAYVFLRDLRLLVALLDEKVIQRKINGWRARKRGLA